MDLVEKARKIKLDMKTGKDQSSVSDGETNMITDFKETAHNNHQNHNLKQQETNISDNNLLEQKSEFISNVKRQSREEAVAAIKRDINMERKINSLTKRESSAESMSFLNSPRDSEPSKINADIKKLINEDRSARKSSFNESLYFEKEPVQPLSRRVTNPANLINTNLIKNDSIMHKSFYRNNSIDSIDNREIINDVNNSVNNSTKTMQENMSSRHPTGRDSTPSPTLNKDTNKIFQTVSTPQLWPDKDPSLPPVETKQKSPCQIKLVIYLHQHNL